MTAPQQRSADQPTRCRLSRALSGDKIGNADQMHAWRLGHLREVHRAEFPGPDQADDERPALQRTAAQFCMQIHLASFP